MQPKVLKYILDIESVIHEMDSFKALVDNNFEKYLESTVVKRATERNLEIIGEAVRKIKELEPAIHISSYNRIIGLRNLIAHAYDAVEDEIIWGIIQRDIPKLLTEIKKLKHGNY